MLLRARPHHSETQKKRSLVQRMAVMHGVLLVALLLIVARLIELQVVSSEEFRKSARRGSDRHIAARRGEIVAVNSRTREPVILATNTTLDLVYVDPLLVDDPTEVAETLADTLLTQEVHDQCRAGSDVCPREFVRFYAPAFDPMMTVSRFSTGMLLEPVSGTTVLPAPLPSDLSLPDLTEARRQFARDIERRIGQKRVTGIAIREGATKIEMAAVEELNTPGITVDRTSKTIRANPEEIPQNRLDDIATELAAALGQDAQRVAFLLRQRELRYVPVLHRLPPSLTLKLKELKLQSAKETQRLRAQAISPQAAESITDPLRCIALIPEHWRFYPDGTVASQIIGFLNVKQEPQYGIERTFDPQLRGQEGIINMVSDLQGRQIVTAEQTIVSPEDGDRIVLTIDPFIQQNVERILQDSLVRYQADSAQVVIMDPNTGRLLAMANAPLFERNTYGDVYRKEAILLPKEKEKNIAVEIYHPETNVRIVNAYLDIFTPEGRARLSLEKQKDLADAEELYDLKDLARYFLYVGQTTRLELFPTDVPNVWLKYRNTIGVGAYLNRGIQAIYEPGSVMKPITMAIAIDQGEVTPDTVYDDKGDVEVDEFTIKNALKNHYGKVSMTQCLAYSINTCMTSVSERLGKKLFHRMVERFGFGKITGIELEDELPGDVLPWQDWSNALLATAAYGQGISSTPLQVITAFAALANGGKLLRPTIIDRIEHADGTIERRDPVVVDQVITPETSELVTGMLYQAIETGYARTAKVQGYRIAGKTGTSQIAGPGGKYEEGTGSTIASFMGFAPVDNPRFIVLVKFDRPKNKEISHGAASAAPLFKEVAAFLFKYYGIPPDDVK